MSWCEWWWVLKFSCSLRVVDEISKADWMKLKGSFLRVRSGIDLEVYSSITMRCTCLYVHKCNNK